VRAPRAPQPALAELPDLLERVRSGGPEVTYTVTGRPRPLSADTEATVYRIVQEALTNVVRHSHASRVTVELAHAPAELTVTVTDDGRGPGTTTGLGLVGIRERAAAHGGKATAGAGPGGRGFQVLVVMPLVTSPEGVGS